MLSRRKSYTEAVQGRRRLARRLGVLLVVFVGYELVSDLFLSTYAMVSSAMSPSVLPGDRVIATPLAFGPSTILGKLPGVSRPERGDIVVVEPSYARRIGFWERLLDSFVRFVSFQILSPARSGPEGVLSAPSLQRVIGLPGDSIRMDDFVFKVKPAGSDQFLTEFELSSRPYDISQEAAPPSWRSDLPGSGHMALRLLGNDEYFVAGDSRSSSGDSRLWGPVGLDRFLSKVLLRYWPPKSFGAL